MIKNHDYKIPSDIAEELKALRARDEEKTLLLSLSEDMATIRDRDALFRTISERLRPTFRFQAAAVSDYSEDYTHYRHLLINTSPKVQRHPLYDSIVGDFFLPLADSPDALILEKLRRDGLYYWHTAEMGERYPHHPLIPLLLESGLRHNVHTALEFQGRLIGFFHVHFSDEADVDENLFGLLRVVAKQMAVCVANILANEEILRREREKSMLLEISQEIAAARNAAELMRAVKNGARQIFSFERIVILIVEDDRKFYYDLARKSHRVAFKESYLAQAVDLLEQAESSIVEDFAARFEQFDGKRFPLPPKSNLKEGIAARLKAGGKTFGVLWFCSSKRANFTAHQLEIFQSLANQTAVAVSHFLTNEKNALQREKAALARAESVLNTSRLLKKSLDRLTANPNSDEILGRILREIVGQLRVSAGYFWFYDAPTKNFNLQMLVTANETRLAKDVPADELGVFAAPIASDELPIWDELLRLRQPIVTTPENAAQTAFCGTLRWQQEHWNLQSGMKVPFILGDEPLGLLCLISDERREFTELELEFAQRLAAHASLAIKLMRLTDAARREAEQAATLAERNRIAREIHDTLAQGFTGVILQLETARRVLNAAAPEKAAEFIARSIEMAREGLAEARRSVLTLRPAADDSQLDLPGLLREKLTALTFGTDIKAEFSTEGKPFPLPPETAVNILRIGQEAVVNALRHSKAGRIKVELDFNGGLCLTITDDGIGFDTNDIEQNQGFGLRGMRERAAAVKAVLEINGKPGGGTEIKVIIGDCG